jgi:hypothetical protein
MTSNPEVYERPFRTTVYLVRKPFNLTPDVLEIEHRGPAEFKLDDKYNLRVEIYPENSDFEVLAALVLADTFWAVTQEEIVEEDIDEDCPCVDCESEYPTPKLEATLASDSIFDDDDETQLHDPNAQEW